MAALCASKIKLKIVDDEKFLGVTGDKLARVDWKDALSIRLNTLENISEKSLEGRDNKALTEKGFWFFPKSYSFQNKDNGGKQAFRIVYYAPNEYLLMKGDSCLGFKDDSKFKRVDCKLNEATRFKMCTNRICDSYVDLVKELECIKGILMGGNSGFPRGMNQNGYNPYGPGYGTYDNRGRNGEDSSTSDSSKYNRRGGKNKKDQYNPYKRGRRGSSSSDSSASDSDGFSGCKNFKYGIPGFGGSNKYGNSKFGRDQPMYGPRDKALGRFGFPYSC